MQYTKLGSTGLDVSRIAFGCMTLGNPGRGRHTWTLDEDSGRQLFQHAIESGITFFDTANTYSAGTSEEIVGRYLKEFSRREEVVIATKVFNTVDQPGPNRKGLSRKAIMTEIDASLHRLDTDYVDLYQVHRWDSETPIAETMEALHDVVKAGKARYIGASNMRAWQFAKAQEVARSRGWTPFVSMQNYVNLAYREEEREMLPLCADQGVGVLPWSPLARGRLTRPSGTETARSSTDVYGDSLRADSEASDRRVIDAVENVATVRGIPMAQIALAWVLAKPEVTAPIVGASKPTQIDDAVAALTIQLTPDEIEILEAPYVTRPLISERGSQNLPSTPPAGASLAP